MLENEFHLVESLTEANVWFLFRILNNKTVEIKISIISSKMVIGLNILKQHERDFFIRNIIIPKGKEFLILT